MTERYFIVREDILPEAIVKTIQVKEMLRRGDAATVHEATERVGLSRSAFYKYKDGVYTQNQVGTGTNCHHFNGFGPPLWCFIQSAWYRC